MVRIAYLRQVGEHLFMPQVPLKVLSVLAVGHSADACQVLRPIW